MLLHPTTRKYTIMPRLKTREQRRGFSDYAPTIKVQSGQTNRKLSFVTSAEEFRFVSFGRPEKSPVNFAIYVSPSDLPTWIILLIISLILSIVITVKARGSISEGLLRCVIVLVEQGHSALLNAKRIPFLYWI